MSKNMDEDSVGCLLQIFGFDSDPEEISSMLVLQPTEVHRKGDIKRKDPQGTHADVLFDTNFWVLESTLPGSASEEQHLDNVLGQINGKEDILRRLAEKYTVHIGFYGKKYYPHVGIFLEKTTVAKLASIGASFGVSTYVFESSYLDSDEKVNTTKKLVRGALSLSREYSPSMDIESGVMVNALAAIEGQAEDLSTLLASLVDEDTSNEERAELLIDIKHKVTNIKKAIEASEYLSQ